MGSLIKLRPSSALLSIPMMMVMVKMMVMVMVMVMQDNGVTCMSLAKVDSYEQDLMDMEDVTVGVDEEEESEAMVAQVKGRSRSRSRREKAGQHEDEGPATRGPGIRNYDGHDNGTSNERRPSPTRTLPFPSVFSNIWAPGHQLVSEDRLSANITLDKHSGSGFKSRSPYMYGYFSAAIKLPSNNTAGVAITFYTSNNDVYPDKHDEIDFEFLGVIPGEPFLVQTNVYGNGSTSIGREQRYHLWFDPTADFHHYSILWTPDHIVFSVDGIPIRELKNSYELGAHYPSKPMSVYATIWDASSWATEGGKYKVNYTYGPFVASYTDFVLRGCRQLNVEEEDSPVGDEQGEEELEQRGHEQEDDDVVDDDYEIDYKKPRFVCSNGNNSSPSYPFSNHPFLTLEDETSLRWVRQNYMVYDYCVDSRRYPRPLPECNK